MSDLKQCEFEPFYESPSGQGALIHGDSRNFLQELPTESVDLIVTSPPFGLQCEKDYGNVPAEDYLDWFSTFAEDFYRVLKESGSLVIDIGGAWNSGVPTRSLYHFKLPILLVEQFGFHLAQEFFWWNKAKLPSPAEWVTIRRIRVKNAVNMVWWLSKTPYPKASNKRVLKPYSKSQLKLFDDSCQAKNQTGERPSGHNISENFSNKNAGSIPPNIFVIPNTVSNGSYQEHCRKNDLDIHPARFPHAIPEFFVRMTTDKDDLVVDPFAGSCVTGEVCDRLGRKSVCVDTEREYLEGAKVRFTEEKDNGSGVGDTYYEVPKTGLIWEELPEVPLPEDGGESR